MNKLQFALLYLIIDICWITLMAGRFYKSRIETIQKEAMQFKIVPAMLAYLLLLFTIFYICFPLAEYYKDKKYHPSVVFGCVGLSVYGVYNFTNGAVLTNHNWDYMLVDTLWGVSCFSFLGWVYHKRFNSL